MLCLGIEVRIGVAVLCLGVAETSRKGSWVRPCVALSLGVHTYA